MTGACVDVAVVCPTLSRANRWKMPWRYFYEIVRVLDRRGHEVAVVTDCDTDLFEDSVDVATVERLFGPTDVTSNCVNALAARSPTVTLVNVTPSLALRGAFASRLPSSTVGVVTGSLYQPRELGRLGLRTLYKYRTYTRRITAESVLPRMLIGRSLSAFDRLVTLSHATKKRLQSSVTGPIDVIPPGITDADLERPTGTAAHLSGEKPSLLYFTSPLTLRGTDVLTKAFAQVRADHDCELVILSRPGSADLNDEEKLLYEIADENGVLGDFTLVSAFLERESIRQHLRDAAIVCLPYKIVLSEVPISLYEAQAMGTPVVSTTVSCIPETIKNGGIAVPPGNVDQTAYAISALLDNDHRRSVLGDAGRETMQSHSRWEDTATAFEAFIQNGAETSD